MSVSRIKMKRKASVLELNIDKLKWHHKNIFIFFIFQVIMKLKRERERESHNRTHFAMNKKLMARINYWRAINHDYVLPFH